MGKQIIRITESDLHRIVKESVQRILKEVRDNSISDKEWNEINSAYMDSGLWRDEGSPNYDKKDDMDWMFSRAEKDYRDGTAWNELEAEYSEPFNNPNIRDNSKRYAPYRNYIARHSEKYMSPEEVSKMGGSGNYLDLWKGHNGI